MFGHDNTQDNTDGGQPVQVSVVSSSTDDTSSPAPVEPTDELNLPAPAMEPMVEETMSAPETEVVTDTTESAPPITVPEPALGAEFSSPPITINRNGALMDLGSLKQEALRELSPLIGHLDQSPDEKYATAKMVYEETNDQALLTSVYEAAKNLSDEKTKAEAIYDVIQKINDFTAKN